MLSSSTVSGAACQASSPQVSPAALAVGLKPGEGKHILRVSFSALTTLQEARLAGEALEAVARDLQAVAR